MDTTIQGFSLSDDEIIEKKDSFIINIPQKPLEIKPKTKKYKI